MLTTCHASMLPTLGEGVLDMLVHLAAGALIALVYVSLCVVLWRIGPRMGVWGSVQRWWRQPRGQARVPAAPDQAPTSGSAGSAQ